MNSYILKNIVTRAESLVSRLLHRHIESKYALLWAASTIMLFTVLILGITLRDSKAVVSSKSVSSIVLLTQDSVEKAVPTRAKTVGEFLKKIDIKISDGDVVEPDVNTEILGTDFRVNVYKGSPVVIKDQGGSETVETVSASTQPRSIADQAGISVYPEDEITKEPSQDFLVDGVGSKVTISRSTEVVINLYGTSLPIRTMSDTVGSLLADRHIVLDEGDNVTPSLETPVYGNMQVFVTRPGIIVESVEETIPMPVEVIEDNSLSFGTSAVRQEGSDGIKSVTYEINTINNQEVDRKIIQEVVIKEAVKQIVARGRAVSISSDHQLLMRQAGISESDFPYVEYIINHENRLWCPTRWQGQNNCPEYYAEKFPGSESHTSTGYGLCQSTPANKMASAGDDWRVNPVTQLKWCANYASRYGGWEGAYNAWIRQNWW